MQEESEAGENSDAGFGVGKGLGLSPTGAPVPAVGVDSTCLAQQAEGWEPLSADTPRNPGQSQESEPSGGAD